jgi:phage gpG-like protein
MSIRVRTNINLVQGSLIKKLEAIRNPKPLLRIVALDVIALVTERIHEEGKAADGGEIGQYSNRYLQLRQGKFKRSGDKKVIVSLTRQLENDWAVIATDRGYGIGFNNPFNINKIRWVESQKGKKIGSLTDAERRYAIEKLKSLVRETLQ